MSPRIVLTREQLTRAFEQWWVQRDANYRPPQDIARERGVSVGEVCTDHLLKIIKQQSDEEL